MVYLIIVDGYCSVAPQRSERRCPPLPLLSTTSGVVDATAARHTARVMGPGVCVCLCLCVFGGVQRGQVL